MSGEFILVAQEARGEIEASRDKAVLETVRVKYLGRKGLVAEMMAKIPTLPVEERNALKREIETALADREQALAAAFTPRFACDITLPGKRPMIGRIHPITQVMEEICDAFGRLGFKVFEGPEIETEFNNFEALNIPLEHPSRDAFDTFYIKDCKSQESFDPAQDRPRAKSEKRLLLRSHTSPAQARALKVCPPPMAVVVPGRVYRPDAVDASHSFMFHQVEGIAVDDKLRFSDLKGILIAFAQEMFGPKTKLRFRPSFFPFTEPSAEVDVSCFLCGAKGCSVCKRSGWLEILGSGMVHPHVLKTAGVDPKKWRGFAFGMGVERIAMLKFGINDIRLFFENDIRFLEQF
jgi:phenylalanyl-tRNA synthetase alpha chain